MAVFLAASDETLGNSHRSSFRRCGFLAPINDWEELTEHWEASILAGPPRIPYLHMTDIRSREWRGQYGLSDGDVDRRLDDAFAIITAVASLTPIGFGLNSAGHLYDTFPAKGVRLSNGAGKKFVPDYVAFPGYVFTVLYFCQMNRPDVEKVDFVVERNGELTDHLREFYEGLPRSMEDMVKPELIPLMGEIIPAGKERVPLQVADVLCWHTRRYSEEGHVGRKGTCPIWQHCQPDRISIQRTQDSYLNESFGTSLKEVDS